MKAAQTTKKNSSLLIAAVLCVAGASPLAHAEETTSDGVSDFLSDPQRVGSLTGTILGGALTAHPIGTLAGSVIGFFVGKETIHKTPAQQPAQVSYARRSFVPTTPVTSEIPMLALNAGTTAAVSSQPKIPAEQPKATAPAVALLASASVSAVSSPTLQTPQTHTAALEPAPTLKQPSPLEQIASLCYGNSTTARSNNPDLQSLCYYHQSS